MSLSTGQTCEMQQIIYLGNPDKIKVDKFSRFHKIELKCQETL